HSSPRTQVPPSRRQPGQSVPLPEESAAPPGQMAWPLSGWFFRTWSEPEGLRNVIVSESSALAGSSSDSPSVASHEKYGTSPTHKDCASTSRVGSVGGGYTGAGAAHAAPAPSTSAAPVAAAAASTRFISVSFVGFVTLGSARRHAVPCESDISVQVSHVTHVRVSPSTG